MKKIKIIRPFMTTHLGFLCKDDEIEVDEGFAQFVVERMNNAAEYVKTPKAKSKAKK